MQNAGMVSPHVNKNTNRGDSRGGSGMREHRVSNKHVNDQEEEKHLQSPHAGINFSHKKSKKAHLPGLGG